MKRVVKLAIVSSIMILGACSRHSAVSPEVLESQKAFETIAESEEVKRYAGMTLFKASKLYDLTKSESDVKKRKHLSYLLKQNVALAKEETQAAKLREKLSGFKDEKNQALLNEKDQALQEALKKAALAKEKSQELESKYQELQELNAQMTKRGIVLTLGDVLFEVGKSDLAVGATRPLEKLVAFMEDNPERIVLIEGHTDNVGSSTYNVDLSLRRADAVAALLQEKGVDASRIVTRGYGKEFPVVSNATATGKQQNRRVEIVILKEGDSVADIER